MLNRGLGGFLRSIVQLRTILRPVGAVQLVDPVGSSEGFFYNVVIRLLTTSSDQNPLSNGTFADLGESIEKVNRLFADGPPVKINKSQMR